jgi:hypothetical protein
LEDIEMNKKTTWWIVLILVAVTMSMAGALQAETMLEASQPENDLRSIISDRFCSRICLEAAEETADPIPEPPPPPIISDRFCDRTCLEAAEETADPIPEPPPPPIFS